MNMDRKAFAGAAAVAAAILVVSPAKAAWNRASVVDVGGVPRFAIDGKPMTATAGRGAQAAEGVPRCGRACLD